MRNILIALSTILVLTSPLIYIKSILRGETKPHRTTRFVLMVIAVLSVSALSTDFRSAAFWLALSSMVQAIITFSLSVKYGLGGWASLDLWCLGIAIVGIVLWQTTGNPIVGLYASIVADVVGLIPTLFKTYKLPYTENWLFFAIDTVASILSFVALSTFTAFSFTYPAYIFVVNAGMVFLILWRRTKVKMV